MFNHVSGFLALSTSIIIHFFHWRWLRYFSLAQSFAFQGRLRRALAGPCRKILHVKLSWIGNPWLDKNCFTYSYMRIWLQGSIADVAWCILTCSWADSIRCGQMLSTSIQILCQAFIHMGFIFIRDKGFNESRSQSWHAASSMHVSSCDVVQCVCSKTLPFC